MGFYLPGCEGGLASKLQMDVREGAEGADACRITLLEIRLPHCRARAIKVVVDACANMAAWSAPRDWTDVQSSLSFKLQSFQAQINPVFSEDNR
jgi:hypothetical protein